MTTTKYSKQNQETAVGPRSTYSTWASLPSLNYNAQNKNFCVLKDHNGDELGSLKK